MTELTSRAEGQGPSAVRCLVAALCAVLAPSAPAAAQEPPRAVGAHACRVDLAVVGQMKDVLSNALMHGLRRPEPRVAAFLGGAEQKYSTGPQLLRAAAEHFAVGEAALAAEVEKWRHCNCAHAAGSGAAAAATPVSAFAKDVTLHVILHELGHALVREFDIPVLGNEETVADAFATYYLTTFMPERAVAVLTARTTSLLIEAREQKEPDWSGEHDHDARRAFQIAALAVAADAEKYEPVARVVGMSPAHIQRARDYGAELRRSWRRVLAPLQMPKDTTSDEARVVYDARNPFLASLCGDGLAAEVEAAARRFDWHSLITIRFVDGDGGARWSRSGRTITVHSGYVRRFVEQGERRNATK